MSKELARNKKAYYDYTILDEYEAGIVLSGGEVKAIKAGFASIKESYVKMIGKDLWLVNANIKKWPQDTSKDYDRTRSRKLLLNRREIDKILLKSAQEGCTIVPLSIYLKGALVKIKIGLAKGKKKFEKKEKLMERQRELESREDIKRNS